MIDSKVLTVTQLNTYVKSLLDYDPYLRSVYVVGEISNFTNHYRTGHFYLTLKDGDSAIKAVMFRMANQRLRFTPENGMNVIVRGRVSIFERDGQYQLYIEEMQPDGVGALTVAFEQLKEKLYEEGLFNDEFKKPIPRRCRRIGVVTSATGAVLQDIKNVVSRRYPLAQIILEPVEVQGPNAAPQIAQAIRKFNSGNFADVLIVGRGGGSIEDLWAFNEEIVARAVFESAVPIISAVGHETDYTICDFVADLRAPTPSAAAELAVPDIRDDISFISGSGSFIESYVNDKLANESLRLKVCTDKLKILNPVSLIDEKLNTVDLLCTEITRLVENKLNEQYNCFSLICAKLDSLNPLRVLSRGYSIATKDGKIVKTVGQVSTGDKITLKFSDGQKECEVL